MRGKTLTGLPPNWEDWTFESSWAFKDTPEGLLGLAWEDQKFRRVAQQPIINLAFVECTTGAIKYQDNYQWQGFSADHEQLWAGEANEDWILTWEGFPDEQTPLSIMASIVHWGIPLSSSTPIIVDQAVNDMTRLGPVIHAKVTGPNLNVVHLKPGVDDVEATLVCLNRGVRDENIGSITEHNVEIDVALKATVSTHKNSWYMMMLSSLWNKDEKIIIELPTGDNNVVEELAQADSLVAQKETEPAKIFRKEVQGKPYWHFWVAGGFHPMKKAVWRYQLPIQIPAHNHPFAYFDEDIFAGATIICGPYWKETQKNEQQTIVAAVGIIKKEVIGLPEEQALLLRGGELICLSQDGQVVQECKEEIVEQVELCLVGDTVIGVDRTQRRWRLWRWEPLAGKEQFTTVQWLDESVVHAHVVTNHENSDPQGTQFWLVEERPEGLRVSRRDGQTLEKTEEPLVLQHYSLPYSLERSIGHWDWPIKKGLIGYEDALLLIAADEQNRMVLYRVEAGMEL